MINQAMLELFTVTKGIRCSTLEETHIMIVIPSNAIDVISKSENLEDLCTVKSVKLIFAEIVIDLD